MILVLIILLFSFEMKHSKQLEESKANSAAAIKELEHLQNEKRKMLMEHETAKLKELDESYSKEFNEWKNNLKPRKQVKTKTRALANDNPLHLVLTVSGYTGWNIEIYFVL